MKNTNTVCAPAPDDGSGMGSGAKTPEAMMQEALKYAAANPVNAPANPHYDQGLLYGQPGLRYPVADPVSVPTPQGAKVRLDLYGRSDANVIQFAQQHIAAMAANANFPAPTPSVPDFLTLFTNYQNALAACEAAKQAQKAATAYKDEQRASLFLGLSQRGDYVQTASNGNAPVILTSGFDVKATPTPIGVLPPPLNLRVDLNGTIGKMIVSWNAVAKARGYVLECAEVTEAPPVWKLIEVGGKPTITLNGQTVGVTYLFRVAAVGGTGGRSDWSTQVSRTAA